MTFLKSKILAFIRDEKGLTTVEYAIAGGLVAAGAIAAFTNLGTEVARVIDILYNAVAGVQAGGAAAGA